jgi:spermidine synthase
MGTTIPVAMFFFKQVNKNEITSFSFLYLANVLGAMLGALISSFVLFELIGFKNSLAFAGVSNFVIALICFFLKIPVFKNFLFRRKERKTKDRLLI